MSLTDYFAGSWRILCGLSQTDLKYILYLIWCPWLTILQDPEEFYVAYDKLLNYVDQPENWPKIEAELLARGVGPHCLLCLFYHSTV